MNCVDFEDLWNEALDAGPSDLERRLEEHAASCAPCRAISARYQTLRQAIGDLAPPPAPSAESTARLLAMMAAAPAPWRRRPALRLAARFAWIPLATAAAVLFLVWPGGSPRQEAMAPSVTTATPLAPVAPDRPIAWALDDAKAATIELALEASAPVARIGREVLADRDRVDGPDPTPARPVDDGVATPPSALIQSVGERFGAGVGPISGSARHAFSFLLGPPRSPSVGKSL